MPDDVSTAELARSLARLDKDMSNALARIEGKLDRVTEDHEQRLRHLESVDIAKVTDDHEQRLRRLEPWMWGLAGTGASTGVLALIFQLMDKAS